MKPPRLPIYKEKVYVPKELTPREREAVIGICHGLTNKEIASDMQVSEQVIKNYLRCSYIKLNITTRSAAVVIAIKRGWFKP
jgi:DNA-binding NarL/FixJ family response regulator